MNKVINISENDPCYASISNVIKNASEDSLVIIARSSRNRKDMDPIAIKNGIYFYVAYDLSAGVTGFVANPTPEMIYKAKGNTVSRARIGGLEILFGGGRTLNEYEYDGNPLIFVTSTTKANGAGILLCEEFLKAAREKIGEFYILPSSIHEVIFVPINEDCPKDFLDATINSVNTTQVSDNEYLGSRAFEVTEWL